MMPIVMKSWYIPVKPPRIARGAFSLMYKGVTIEAAPTPNPAMNLPTNIEAM